MKATLALGLALIVASLITAAVIYGLPERRANLGREILAGLGYRETSDEYWQVVEQVKAEMKPYWIGVGIAFPLGLILIALAWDLRKRNEHDFREL